MPQTIDVDEMVRITRKYFIEALKEDKDLAKILLDLIKDNHADLFSPLNLMALN